jgi:nucleoid DNA-binding protein
MTKADIVEQVSKQTGFTKVETDYIFNTILDTMKNSLEKGDRIEIRGFGNFTVKHLAGKEARNPKTNEKIWVKERFVPKFKVSKLLIDSVNKSQLRGF